MKIAFQAFTSKRWDTKRWQPEIFLADEKDWPFTVPVVDENLIAADIGDRSAAALHARFPVSSFGEVTLPTGVLAAGAPPYNLNVEIARERILRIESKVREWGVKGFIPSETFEQQLTDAKRIFEYTGPDESEERKSRWADLSLTCSMPAGEQLAMEYAEWCVARRRAAGGFKDFLLGANCFWYPETVEKCAGYFTKALNYATMPFYWGRTEPVKGELRLANLEAQVEWLGRNGIKKKGHPLFWLLCLPGWLDIYSDLNALKEQIRRRILQLCTHFRGRVEYYDIINEMHNWNIYTQEEMYKITQICADCVREADPDAKRVVNINEPFGEYMARDVLHLDRTMIPIDVKRQLTMPEEYIRQLIRQGVDFEVIGIQMYYGAAAVFCRDLFEISRYFDKYEEFGKPVHLSEMGVPSAEGEDPGDSSHKHNYCSYTYWRASDSGFWHGPWTHDLQAEFIEKCYKILMGKPFIKAITYWDFSDGYDHFFTHSGLLDADNRPKKSYEVLLKLRKLMGI